MVPRSQPIQGAFAQWRDQVLAAVSILAALLDERVAQRELLEDLIVYDSTGSRPWASVDTGVRVRDFLPKKRVLSEQRQLLEQLATFDLSHERAEFGAGRWYLRAVQSGPTPDAVVFLWIAMEALAPPTGKGDTRSDVRRVEEALTEPGWRWISLSCPLAVLLVSEPTSCTRGSSSRSCCTRVSTSLRPSLGSSFDTGSA